MPTVQQKWDQHYQAELSIKPGGTEPKAAFMLQEFSHLLPTSGDALDLACGLGGNALWLARLGLQVQAWDISPIAISALASLAESEELPLQAVVHNAITLPPPPESFDVIVVSYFLERTLAPYLQAALRPGGILFYQTFVQNKTADTGPTNPAFLLTENELIRLFPGLILRTYRDEATCGDTQKGLRNEAFLIGQKANQ